MGNLLPQGPDLGVLGHLVVLTLLNSGLKILDLLPQADSLSGDLATSLLDAVDGVILSLDAGIGLVNLLLQIVSCVLETGGFVNNFLDSRSTRLESKNQLVLLSSELIVDIGDSIALVSGATNVGLSLSNLVLVLFLVL